MKLIRGFTDRLEKAIQDSGKTYNQVCREAGISRTLLYSLRTGERGASAFHVARLSGILQVSSDWLLGLSQ